MHERSFEWYYEKTSCSVEAGLSCTFNGQEVKHGDSVLAFSSETVPYGGNCSQESLICENGSSLEGFLNCSVNDTRESILFASQYDRLSSPVNDAWTKTKEGGLVYVAAGWSGGVEDQAGKWDYGWYETSATDVSIRQSFGKQWAHNTALDDNDTVYINVKAPGGSNLNASVADTLVIQMGNGAEADKTNTHNVFTVTLNGGSQNSTDYSWSEVCSFDQKVSSTHKFGLDTYYIPLNSFNCTDGNLGNMKSTVSEVVVKVIKGKNPSQDNSIELNHTMPSVGFIGFTGNAISSGNSSYVLFASQYITTGKSSPSMISKEGGEVYGFSKGKFTYADYDMNNAPGGLGSAQAYGGIYRHTEPITSEDYFGWSIKGPNNSSVNASGASNLVIQLGNAQNESVTNSHSIFTIDLKDSTGNVCPYDQMIDDNTRPPSSGNDFGLQTYYIPLSNFAGCNLGIVSEIGVKVVGGKDTSASASSSNNDTFPIFGFIGFTK